MIFYSLKKILRAAEICQIPIQNCIGAQLNRTLALSKVVTGSKRFQSTHTHSSADHIAIPRTLSLAASYKLILHPHSAETFKFKEVNETELVLVYEQKTVSEVPFSEEELAAMGSPGGGPKSSHSAGSFFVYNRSNLDAAIKSFNGQENEEGVIRRIIDEIQSSDAYDLNREYSVMSRVYSYGFSRFYKDSVESMLEGVAAPPTESKIVIDVEN